MSGSFQKLYSFWNFSRRWISCADSKGSESRNIYDLNFRITILYRSHRAIKIWEIFICFRLLHKKSENLMISYVLNKKFPFNFRFPYIDPHVGCSWMESHHECLDVHKLTWRVLKYGYVGALKEKISEILRCHDENHARTVTLKLHTIVRLKIERCMQTETQTIELI